MLMSVSTTLMAVHVNEVPIEVPLSVWLFFFFLSGATEALAKAQSAAREGVAPPFSH